MTKTIKMLYFFRIYCRDCGRLSPKFYCKKTEPEPGEAFTCPVCHQREKQLVSFIRSMSILREKKIKNLLASSSLENIDMRVIRVGTATISKNKKKKRAT